MCQCQELAELVDISSDDTRFKSKLHLLEVGDCILLMSCPSCRQLWRVDPADKYQTCYAVKLPSNEDWQYFNAEARIKQRMVQNRGGLGHAKCIWAGCSSPSVNGVVYCVDHLWRSGARS